MPPRDPARTRPAIWTEGRQHPRLEARAFGRASLVFARAGLASALTRASAGTAGFGAAVMAGRWKVPPHRLGRSGRWLPSHRRVGAALLTLGVILAVAGEVQAEKAGPERMGAGKDAPPAPAPAVTLRRPVRHDARPESARPLPSVEDADLAAIRALLAEPFPDPPPDDDRAAESPAPEIATDLSGDDATLAARPGLAVRLAGLGLAHALLVPALAWGAVRAGIAHLEGEDLRRF